MNAKKIVVFGLVVLLAAGSVAVVFASLTNDDSSSSSPSSTASTASTTSTTRVEFTGTGSEAFCQADAQLNDQLSKEAPTTASDSAALAAYFQKKVDAIKQLETLAPPEVKADVTTTIAAYEAYRPLLAAVGWDQSKITAQQESTIQTPAVTAAGQRLSQYTERICKLGTGN